MSIVWTASVESYRRVIAEKKHMVADLETELAIGDNFATWYIRNQLINIKRQIEDLEEWLKKLEEKREK
jgi:hypothetical protein